MLVNFVVWGTRPTGVVDPDTAAWLAPFVASPQPTKAMRRLVQELAREAEHVDDALLRPSLNSTTQHAELARASLEQMALAA